MTDRKALTLNKGSGRWIALALLIILIAGLLVTWWTLQRADRQMRNALLLNASLVAQAVNINRVQTLTGNAADIKKIDYQRLKEQFSLVRQVNDKCRFIYLLGRKTDGKIFIYVDSEPAGSRDYSPPGQLYEEAPASYRRVFDTTIAAVEGPVDDRWGKWITALVPVTDPATGKVIALLGMDIDAREWEWDVVVNASLPVFLILTLLILLTTGLFTVREQIKHKESETRYRKVIENAGQGIIVIQEGMIRYGNPAIAAMLGYSRQDIYSTPFREFIHPDDVNMVVENYQKRIAGKQDIHAAYKFRVLTKDGSIRWFEIHATMIEWEGKPASLNFLTDLTERMKFDEVLRESENKFRSIFENTQDVYYQTDLEGIIREISPSIEKYTSFERGELIGKPVSLFYSDPQDRDNYFRAVLEKGEVVDYELRLKTKDDRLVVTSTNSHIIFDAQGKPAGIEGSLRDITARKRTEKDLADRLIFQQALIDSIPYPIFTKDVNGRFVGCNRTYEREFGTTRDYMIGKTVLDLDYLPIEERRRFQDEDMKVISEVSRRSYEMPIIYADGETHLTLYSVDGFRLADGNPGGLIGMLVDMTERKRMEDALRQSEERYRSILDEMDDVYFEVDLAGNYTFVNEANFRILGYSEKEIIGTNVGLYMDKEAHDTVRNSFNNIYRTGNPERNIFYKTIDKEGNLRFAEITGFPLKNQKGDIIGFRGIARDITERNRAEAALRESESRYRTILDEMEEGYQELDLAGNFTFVNEAFLKIGGYNKDEILGSNFSLYFTDEATIKKVYHTYNQIYKTGIPLKNLEWNIRRKDGAIRTVDFFASLLHDANNLPTGFRGIIRDITDIKLVEAELRESEERYRTILDEMEEGYQEVDLAGNYTFFNEAFLRIFGYSRDEMLGTNFRIYSAEEMAAEKVYRAYNQTYKTGVPLQNLEWDIRRKDGAIRTIDFYASLLLDANNNPIGFRGIVHDITDIKRVEAELRESEIRMRSVTDSAQDAILMMNTEGRVSYWNPAAERILGYTSAEALGQDLHSFIAPARYLEAHRAAFPKFLKTGEGAAVGKTLDLEARRKDGKEISVQLSLSAIQINKSWHAVGIMRDITDRKRAEEQMREMNRILADETARANEMAEQAQLASTAKSEFLANMSHEIRTPMNGVIGMTGLLLDTELTGEQRRYAETVRSSGESLMSLINDILDFSKIEAGKLDMEILDFNLDNLLEDFAAIMALRAHDKGLELLYSADRQVPVLLRGDPGRLRQILINLAGNAIKFTHQGEVAIRISLVDEESVDTSFSLQPSVFKLSQPILLRFAVRDTGIGIPQSKLGLIFDKFTQADASTTRKYGGTGLGLAISKQLVQMMGGDIGVVSEEGKGSEFWFTVRLHKQAEESKITAHLPANFHNVKVLIVDDNATNREILTTRLAAWGMRPAEAIDAPAALRSLQLAQDEGDPFWIAIIDMQMPEMDGEALGRAIKADPRLTDLRMVMLTSLGSRGDSRRLQDIGFSAYLNKPSRHQDLFNVLSMLLADRGSFTPQPKTIITRHSARDLLSISKKGHARVLLAEDNITNQQVALGILNKLGIFADAVADGAEAVKTLETVPYDLVLMDVQMPVMDGLTATRTIRNWQLATGKKSKVSTIPIIAMTAHAMQSDRDECLEAGMNDYLSKPVSPEELRDMLEKWLPSEEETEKAQSDNGEDAEKKPVTDKGKTANGKKYRIPVWDRAGMLKRMMDDEDLARSILASFLADIPQQIHSLKAFLKSGDVQGSERQAHTIKGASANIGGEKLRAVAFEMEKSAKSGNLSAASARLADLEEQFDSLKMEIGNWKL